METQGQGWLRGAILAGGMAAALVYVLSKRKSTPPATTAVTGVAEALESTKLGRRASGIGQLLFGNVADDALADVKRMLKDVLQKLEAIVDEL